MTADSNAAGALPSIRQPPGRGRTTGSGKGSNSARKAQNGLPVSLLGSQLTRSQGALRPKRAPDGYESSDEEDVPAVPTAAPVVSSQGTQKARGALQSTAGKQGRCTRPRCLPARRCALRRPLRQSC